MGNKEIIIVLSLQLTPCIVIFIVCVIVVFVVFTFLNIQRALILMTDD